MYQMRSENDAYNDRITSPLNMEEIKAKAINELGLHYPSEDQIRYYDASDIGYVRQYRSVEN